MSTNTNIKYRIKFKKYGTMIYLGHLDIMRYFQKALRRAKVPVAYSGGFSPHQILSFAAPLGVGQESDGEYFDMECTEAMAPDAICSRLAATMVDGMEVLSVVELPTDATNAMASVAAAGYVLSPKDPQAFMEHAQDFLTFLQQDAILYEKETKRSTQVIDLKQRIFAYDIGEDASIYLLVDASSSGNIKPMMVVDAFYQAQGLTLGAFDFSIKRVETYHRGDQDMLMPLNQFS